MTDLMTIIYTSGTTGNPKGVMHTYRSFSFGAQNATRVLKINKNDRYPFYHSHILPNASWHSLLYLRLQRRIFRRIFRYLW